MLGKILESFRKKPPTEFFYLYLFVFWLMNVVSEQSIDVLRVEAEKFVKLPINPEVKLVLSEFIEAVEWRDGEQTVKSIEEFLNKNPNKL